MVRQVNTGATQTQHAVGVFLSVGTKGRRRHPPHSSAAALLHHLALLWYTLGYFVVPVTAVEHWKENAENVHTGTPPLR